MNQNMLWEGRIVGMFGFYGMDWSHGKTSIGYLLDEASLGKGLMTAACRAMTRHALVELKFNRVEIRCAPENHRSRAIPRRLGYSEEGRLREVDWLYDHFEDHIVYSLLAGELQKLETESQPATR